jgi:hypothetical protein
MSYFTGRPSGSLPAIIPGLGSSCCPTCAMGADSELSSRAPTLLLAAGLGLLGGIYLSKRKRA